jgi:hypothetical protein
MAHIANLSASQGYPAIATANTTPGMICKVTDTGNGKRTLTPIANNESALLVSGGYGVAIKYSTDPAEVTVSSAPSEWGNRLNVIYAGDVILEARKGAIIEYTAAELDDSLNPDATTPGTLPTAGQALGIKGSKFATITAATATGIPSPVVGKVLTVNGKNEIRIELVY